jgi:hypothetical protein
MLASLITAGAAMTNVGCSSSTNPPPDGATGTGGHVTTGSGGSDGGSPDAAVTHLVNYTFDTGLQGWAFSTYADPNSTNLTGTYPTDGGFDVLLPDAAATLDGGAPAAAPTLTFDSTTGNPNPGSLKVTATFTAYGQYVDAQVTLTPTVDLRNNILHGRLQLTSGTFSGGAQLHASTGADYSGYASGAFAAPTLGTWSNAMIDMSTQATTINPAVVIQVGVQIFSGMAPTAGAAYPNAGVPVVFNIDTVTD